MSLGRAVWFLPTCLLVAGCAAMYNAYEAQRVLDAKGREDAPVQPAEKVSLADYSLKELVEFAMTNRPSVAAAALAVADARLALREIAADAPLVSYSPWTAPHLALSGGYSAASEAGKHLAWKTEGNASAGLSLQVLLFDFGRNQAQADAQVERLIAAEHSLVQEGFRVFEEVAVAYFGLMESDALLKVAQTNEVEYALHLRQARARLAAGEAQKLDVARARLDLSQARELTIAASNTVITTGAQLMKALGIDAARGTCEEVYPIRGDTLSVVVRGFPDTRDTVESAFDQARTNAPSMAIARARLRSASYSVDRAVADLLPEVSAEVGLSWADPLWAWHWGVSAAQSVFQGFRKVTAVDRAVVALQSAATDVDEAEQQLSLDLETAIAVRDNAVKARETARASVIAARENLDMVKAQYSEGEVSRVDFTDSVSDYATALGSRITAFYRGQVAEAKLFAITGKLPDFREELVKEK